MYVNVLDLWSLQISFGFNRKNLFFRVRAMNLTLLDDNLLLRGGIDWEESILVGSAGQKASKSLKIFVATLQEIDLELIPELVQLRDSSFHRYH